MPRTNMGSGFQLLNRLQQYQSLLLFLDRRGKNPPSLHSLSVFSIRNSLKMPLVSSVPALPLPNKIKQVCCQLWPTTSGYILHFKAILAELYDLLLLVSGFVYIGWVEGPNGTGTDGPTIGRVRGLKCSPSHRRFFWGAKLIIDIGCSRSTISFLLLDMFN